MSTNEDNPASANWNESKNITFPTRRAIYFLNVEATMLILPCLVFNAFDQVRIVNFQPVKVDRKSPGIWFYVVL